MRKKLLKSGIDPNTHQQISDLNLLSQMLLSSNNMNLIPFVNPSPLGWLQDLLLLQAINSNSNANSNSNLLPYLLQAAMNTSPHINNQQFFQPQQNIILSNSLLNCEGGEFIGSHQGILLPVNNDNKNMKNSEYSLPLLVSGSATPESSSIINVENTTKNSSSYVVHNQARDDDVADIFDTWDKFLDDEACSSSFWKDIMG